MLAVLVAAALVLFAWKGPSQVGADRKPPNSAPLLLFTSLPLYWGEAADVGAMLGKNVRRHWARTAIEQSRPLQPLDTLEPATLSRRRDLLIVQPRPLSPDENVALDRWVADGGRVLLFADPALTADSRFAIGDRRRHQDVVMLSPILGRWGLELAFYEGQELGEREAPMPAGAGLPVNLPGKLEPKAGGRRDARCEIEAAGWVAECAVSRGRAVIVADAALFEDPGEGAALDARRAALAALLADAFPR